VLLLETERGREGLQEIPGEFELSTRTLVSLHLNISLALTYEVSLLALAK